MREKKSGSDGGCGWRSGGGGRQLAVVVGWEGEEKKNGDGGEEDEQWQLFLEILGRRIMIFFW